MGTKKKVFITRLYTVAEAQEVALRGGHATRVRVPQGAALLLMKLQISMDSHAEIARL